MSEPKATALLTADAILAAEDLQREEVKIPEWGGSVLVRELTALERSQLGQGMIGATGEVDPSKFDASLPARVVALGVIDQDGTRLFTDEQIEALGAKSANAIQAIVDVVFRLSGMRAEDLEEGKAS